MSARILIVDDLPLARTGIRWFLIEHAFRVCGEAADGGEAVDKVRELKPDVVLMDISMPGMNGISAAHKIRRTSPATKIVFLTVHNLPGVKRAAGEWSDGFVAKSAAGTELVPLLKGLTGKPRPRTINDLYDSP